MTGGGRLLAGRSIAADATVVLLAASALLAGCGAGDGGASRPTTGTTPAVVTGPQVTATAPPATATPPPQTRRPTPAGPPAAARAGPVRRVAAPFAVGLRVMIFVDRTRRLRYPGDAPMPRRLVTMIRYPATGPPSRADVPGARALRGAGPFPLIVFGHGFAVTDRIYASLLDAWARAGYVVAAPLFPLENANAPGGPDESDLVHQPRDMSFVISRMLAASAEQASTFAGLIDPQAIAVSGQSDGGETALAVAYYPQFRDRRVSAAAILSGANIPGAGGVAFPAPSPPLLATQGTADVINPPRLTHAFFDSAPAPKYLLTLYGASHLGPYTNVEPQLGIVERTTIAFFDEYLKHAAGAGPRLRAAGDVAGVSVLHAAP